MIIHQAIAYRIKEDRDAKGKRRGSQTLYNNEHKPIGTEFRNRHITKVVAFTEKQSKQLLDIIDQVDKDTAN